MHYQETNIGSYKCDDRSSHDEFIFIYDISHVLIYIDMHNTKQMDEGIDGEKKIPGQGCIKRKRKKNPVYFKISLFDEEEI